MNQKIKDFVLAYLNTKGSLSGTTEEERLACAYIDLGVVDSMGIVDLILEFENQFQIKFPPEQLQSPQFRTVGGLIQIIENLSSQS